ncbi:MAG TPA: N-acetylglucosamine-6-phosphate deacetylase [Acidobacteriaceae bacterium]|nr:N-acetylglucosamine-6-phosphate deacetylase [Acidobacteriaceae bacterium]
MSVREISATRLITADAVIERPRITIGADGMIASIEPDAASADETAIIAPAFFDVHVHGAAGADVMEGSHEAMQRVGHFLATHGVGHFLATTVTAPVDATRRALERIADAIDASARECAGARPVGIHLEGPFISHAKRGVHPPAAIQRPSVELFDRFQTAARGHIKLMTVAPEVEGATALIRHASGNGVRVSIGHSNATALEARSAIRAGAVSATHTFNAMRALDHREPGIAGVVLDERELYAELICDGIHVSEEFVRLWFRAKGRARAILVTDGISATGMPDGDYLLGGLEVTVANGRCLLKSDLAAGKETLAGSVLTMDRAVANLEAFLGAGLGAAVRAASTNPARMLGMETLGDIAADQPANFNVYAADGRLERTVLRGREVANR